MSLGVVPRPKGSHTKYGSNSSRLIINHNLKELLGSLAAPFQASNRGKSMPEELIERCPHDRENPYSIISNALLRDESISPNCRWLLSYLLSMRDDWKVRVSQLISHLKPHMGRDKVRKMIREAIDAGYMVRIEFKEGNLKRSNYRFAETPKFKKTFPCTGFQEAGAPEVGKQPPKKELTKEVPNIINPPLPPPFPTLRIILGKKGLKKKKISFGFTEEEFEEAWKRAMHNKTRVGHVEKWLDSTLASIRLENEAKMEIDQRAADKLNQDNARHLEGERELEAQHEQSRLREIVNNSILKEYMKTAPKEDYVFHTNYFRLNVGPMKGYNFAYDDPALGDNLRSLSGDH